jgi:hypothetical protein
LKKKLFEENGTEVEFLHNARTSELMHKALGKLENFVLKGNMV